MSRATSFRLDSTNEYGEEDHLQHSAAGEHRRLSRHKITISHGNAKFLKYQLQESHMFKVVIDGDDGGVDMRKVHERIEAALRMRPRYKKVNGRIQMTPLPSRVRISQENGVYKLSDHDVSPMYSLQSWSTFASDVQHLRLTVGNTTCIKACSHRLNIMQERSRMFFLLNADIEEKHNFRKAGGVFSKATKVDNSVLLSRSTDAQETLDFILDWYSRYPDAPLRLRDGTNSTLREIFEVYEVKDPSKLTVEGLGWRPTPGSVENADFALDSAPLSSELRYSFLHLRGSCAPRFLQKRLQRAEQQVRYVQATEYSIPLYATYPNELADIAMVLNKNNIGPYGRNMWILQVCFMRNPPFGVNYPVSCNTIQDQLDFIFLPLFKATLYPTVPNYATIAWFLEQVGGFVIRPPANVLEADFDEKSPVPSEMPYGTKANELYYLYYMYANLTVLNSLRKRKGLNTFQLRCSGGNRTSMDGLLAGYLLGDVITRATEIMDYPVLQYLCGLHGVGLTVSPLHDHIQGIVHYQNHPLPNFLHRCLNVAIATEAPLLYHHGSSPLFEEYGTAMKICGLSFLDLTELARNSVMISSFPLETKKEWLGENFNRGVEGNAFELSQVTNVRLAFREESWDLERGMLKDLYINRSLPREAIGSSRWHYISNVKEVEYHTVLDTRVRFPRTVLNGPHKEVKWAVSAARGIARAMDLRFKYIWEPPNPWEVTQQRSVEADFQRKTDSFNEDDWTYAANDAVFISFPKNVVHAWPRQLPTVEKFRNDLKELQDICASSDVKDFSQKRLENLEHRFRLHLALNHANEAGTTEDRVSSNRDIYQAVKVDTHIHMAAGMTGRQLLSFVVKKLMYSGDDIATKRGDLIHTLGHFFKKNGITKNLTVDQLNVQADHTLFERFDNFNNKYNPMENPELRSLLLKTDNFMKGRYFAELIQDVFAQYSRDRHTYAENRVSIYGINIREWDNLALWFSTHGMSSKHNKWVIQVPRVYKVFRAQNLIGSFGQYLQNIFQPLWEASLHPSEHPLIHHFLNHMSGFDSVDNEATLDLPFLPVSPWAWTSVENPPYNYYLYYLYANIRTLNEFRASRGFSTFALRPHCGESGSAEHLYGAFLCANSICHGINLRDDFPMQYLFYLSQIGLHVSPLSNNALFLRFLKNPFPEFFRRGLNVSLSTDDPLMFHQTQEPLIEEYSIAARVWGLSPNDLCEIARNSVLQSGFDYVFKRDAIGDQWYMSSSLGNDSLRTHLSDIRVAFRFETYHTEMDILELCSGRPIKRCMLTTNQEEEINEKNFDVEPEKVILSTHDQAIEIMLREVETGREQLRVSRVKVDALRRQQKSLVDKLTELAIHQQEMQEEAERCNRAEALRYERRPPTPPDAAFMTSERATVQRLLRWRPKPLDVLNHTTESSVPLKNPRRLPSLTAPSVGVRRTI
ncbi:adenosine monophosphate deaminase-like protein [Trypanosoma cruzi]|uniref:AMP deaminase n=2 Tax=Trypanosoma cruzi TaxID=5693 RepID=V5ARK9_TRYCR|nr:AMP deaminase [Trypanosoma cruzi Dm28c]KAF8284022.1 putative AMP deaminase [Trypanosoma cruzi]PBJ73403.1 AMP deaminase [Trypanosoma cruzi cruzi]PWV02628.1 putative AMP deaminase [Trypanosoma cruzi]RNF15590.1 adenosine monophosphate deaminase-like protein [Trypanosoma cruzi]